MKKILFIIAFFAAFTANAQQVAWGPGTWLWSNGTPGITATNTTAKVVVDTVTWRWYEWTGGSSWTFQGWKIQNTSGCVAPAYTPGKHQSYVVWNGCDSLYGYRDGAWRHLNKGGTGGGGGSGTVTQFNFTDGNGFDGTVTNATTTPTLSLATTVSGIIYGNSGALTAVTVGSGLDFTAGTLSAIDQSATNEIQTLSYSTPTVSLSNGGGSVNLSDLNETVSAGTGITVNNVGQNYEVVNSAPDQTVTITGANGTYPSFALPLTAVSEGYGIDIAGTTTRTITVDTSQVATPYDISQATQTVSAGTGISVNQVGQDYTVTNTGDLSATNEIQQIQTAGTADVNLQITGGGGSGIETTLTNVLIPSNGSSGEVLTKGSGTNYSWAAPADGSATNELNTAFTVTAGNLRITDAGGNLDVPVTDIAPVQAVAAGTGISISGTTTRTVTNTAPDQTVSITGAGINAVTGTYPNFTVTATEVDGSATNELQTVSTGTNTLTLSDGGGTVTVDTDPTNDLTTSSTAGGDLSGTFSNLQIVADAVGQTEIAAGAVGSSELASTTVTAGTYTNATVTFDADGRATSASSGNDGFNDVFQVSGGNLEITDGGGTLTVPVSTIAADQSTTNELQTLSFTSPNLSISSGNSVDLTGVPGTVSTNSTLTGTGSSGSPLGIAQQGATTGQVIKWSGTAWLPEDESEIGTGTDPMWGTDSRVISTPLNTVKVYMGEDPDGSITGYSDPFGVFVVEVAGSADDDYSKMRFAMQEGSISASIFNPTTDALVGSTILTPLSVNQNSAISLNTSVGSGDVIIGAASVSNQRATVSSRLRLQLSYTPTGTADTNGFVGDVVWDDDYWYVKTSAGWKRAALSTF